MKKLILTFDRDHIPPSLNGAGGLIRMHYRVKKEKQNILMWMILEQNKPKIKFEGRVRVITTGHSVKFSDWDNFASRFKLIGDALTHLEIIPDDSPKYIVEFVTLQVKCKKMNQAKYIVEIEELPIA